MGHAGIGSHRHEAAVGKPSWASHRAAKGTSEMLVYESFDEEGYATSFVSTFGKTVAVIRSAQKAQSWLCNVGQRRKGKPTTPAP